MKKRQYKKMLKRMKEDPAYFVKKVMVGRHGIQVSHWQKQILKHFRNGKAL